MNRLFFVALLSGALLPVAAHAQNYTVQVGVQQPTNKWVRQATQDTGFVVGVGYALPRANNAGTASVEGLFTRGKGNGNALETTGLYLAERLFATNKKTYYGAGIGYTRSKLGVSVAQEGTTPVSNSATREGVGYRLMAGTLLTGGVTLELGYNGNPAVTVAGTKYRTDAVTLTVGKKF